MKIQILIKSFCSILLFAMYSCCKNASDTMQRTKQNINEHWLYFEDDSEGMPELSKEWSKIDLPHTWNNLDVTDNEPGYRRNASWYKKTLEIPTLSSACLYALYFEGANCTSQVFVNGEKAGEHIGGYIGFEIDVSKFIKEGTNEILVRVDNGYNPELIPSQKSDFFIYGGITRDVWWLVKPKTHLAKLKISTPVVSNDRASMHVDVQINNLENEENLFLKTVLKNSKGIEVLSKKEKVSSNSMEVALDSIVNPELWDTKNPILYSVSVSLLKEGVELDVLHDKVGFRWFEFKKNGPFYLNGKRLLLRGTHRHEEHAGVGAAMSNEQHWNDMKSIKKMGANFVRLAHYPQDPEIYKACDSLGLLVWDELPWCRGGVGNDVWKKNAKNLLTEMIVQNQNHPSIIIWSLGNEIYWLPDFENGDDTEKINSFLTELNDLAHELDPSRKTAIRKYYEGADIVDVFSPSIWSGWYSGSYKSYQKAIDLYKKQYPHFIHAEYGGSSHLGRHSENPITGEGRINSDGWEEAIVQTDVANIAQIGDWSENYIVDLFDWHLRISELDATFVGNIQWAFKDFGTPLRPENDIPYMNQKGITDRNGIPKDAYYVFKSYWSDEPFTYIESHTWTERQGPKNKAREISVYSNCSEVELYQNGKSLGTKKRDITKFPASGLTWNVNFKKGENDLVAVGKSKGQNTYRDSLKVNYRFVKNGPAKSLRLSYEVLENGNYLVSAIAVDKNNLRCLDYENRVYFQCLSGGATLKHQGTPTGSEIINMANGEASIEVVPSKEHNKTEIMVLNQNFKGTYLTLE
ncbi:glycoside hydrolase family 2 protein [Flavicella marina]|uniref:glycoside hydrolase family 2 protein n=1 Tax=Flavicella marina TaxID=1475951 RepID=UPI0012657F2B|nr:glycoside hydrolase family 2 TIM barrel-domain containing protein [Flavicella marina]